MKVETVDGWELAVEGFDDEHIRVHNALFALAAQGLGTSGGSLLTTSTTNRWIVVAGMYEGEGPETHLLTGPVLTGLAVEEPNSRLRRTLDLRRGLLHEVLRGDGAPIEMTRFVSLARPGIVVVRTTFPGPIPRGPAALAASDDPILDRGVDGDIAWTRVAADGEGGIAVGVHETRLGPVVDNVAAVVGDPDSLPTSDDVAKHIDEALAIPTDDLRAEQEDAWRRRWDVADVVVPTDDLQLPTRFALFHLMSSVADHGEAAVGARGLTGTAYRGHVFWDSDTFVMPFLAATHPPSARAILEYRVRRLSAARANARALGRAGARFPWESARTGRDVTPRAARDRTGNVVKILTGEFEEHITADVAWAASLYLDWTDDEAFRRGPALALFVETARYWASRVEMDTDGRAHIREVIGPDEYHEAVDDNAFTNVMARWNLRRAATAVAEERGESGVDDAERAAWLAIADAIVDGYDPGTERYEQFDGFSRLEPLIISDVAPRRPIAADLLLGAERVRGAQVIKQPDVLMLHHLVPDEVAPGSLDANLRYYEPRCAHGSSLSPAIHASLFARTRQYERAISALRIAARIDLDDLTQSTAGGLHLATMGGLWQALAFGFAGIRPRNHRLVIDPHVPPGWDGFEVRVVFRGSPVRVHMRAAWFSIETNAPTAIEVSETPYTLGAGTHRFQRHDLHWELLS